jgi:phage shock protein PspC (stress-responsive transcriptional regulator)
MRPRANRKIAGVCAGVAEYFDLDVTLVRVVWLVTAVLTGIGLLSYPIAWIIIPEEPAAVDVPAGYPAHN